MAYCANNGAKFELHLIECSRIDLDQLRNIWPSISTWKLGHKVIQFYIGNSAVFEFSAL
jgi:hypothetical protein